MSRTLPARPNLDYLREQAKGLLRGYVDGNAEAAAAFGPRKADAWSPKLADAQHAVAREYGFANWPALKNHVESLAMTDAPRALEAAVRLDDAQRVRDVLARFPTLADHLNDAMPGGDFGATPLIAAANQRNREMIDVLLDAGADINQRTHWWAGGFGVLDSQPELDEYLVSRGATVDAHDAARFGLMNRLEELVAADPQIVNARFGDGQTALHVASSVEIASFLLDHGADIDALDVDHESTPAQYLVREHQDVVRFLISRGCRTDILMASAIGNVDLVKRQLAANPGLVWTTVSRRHFPMNDSRAGGTIYIWTLGKSKSAHALAREFGHEDIVALLMQYTPPDLALAIACDWGDEAAVARLRANRPVSIADLNSDILARLPGAAESDNTVAVRLMLSVGWPVDARNDSGATALHWAAFHGNIAMARELLRLGADANVKESSFNATPRGWAEYGAGNCLQREARDYSAVIEAISSAGGV